MMEYHKGLQESSKKYNELIWKAIAWKWRNTCQNILYRWYNMCIYVLQVTWKSSPFQYFDHKIEYEENHKILNWWIVCCKKQMIDWKRKTNIFKWEMNSFKGNFKFSLLSTVLYSYHSRPRSITKTCFTHFSIWAMTSKCILMFSYLLGTLNQYYYSILSLLAW